MTTCSDAPSLNIAIDLRDMAGSVTGLWNHAVTLDDGTFLQMGISEGEHGFRWIVSGDTELGVGASDGKGYGSYEQALDAAIAYLSGLQEQDPPVSAPRAAPPRPGVTRAEVPLDSLRQHRAKFTQLYRRYQRLSRCSSAADQRERSALQGPLMELYRSLHPEMISVHFDDDFDVVMRAERRA